MCSLFVFTSLMDFPGILARLKRGWHENRSRSLVSWSQSSFNASVDPRRHARVGHPEPPLNLPLAKGRQRGGQEFRLALAIASLAEMTFELFNELLGHHMSHSSP
jgi:hypothetical protein